MPPWIRIKSEGPLGLDDPLPQQKPPWPRSLSRPWGLCSFCTPCLLRHVATSIPGRIITNPVKRCFFYQIPQWLKRTPVPNPIPKSALSRIRVSVEPHQAISASFSSQPVKTIRQVVHFFPFFSAPFTASPVSPAFFPSPSFACSTAACSATRALATSASLICPSTPAFTS